MKQLSKEIFVLVIKALAYLFLYLSFIITFATRNPALFKFSRTLAVTSSVFILMVIITYSIYGGLTIGKQKSRPIIVNLSLASFITTTVSYVFLMIMNTNPNNNNFFKLDDLDLLAMTWVIQFIIIYVAAHFGNYYFFRNHKPSKVVIFDNKTLVKRSVVNHLNSYKKEYIITQEIPFDGCINPSQLEGMDIIIALDLPTETLQDLTFYAFENNKRLLFNAHVYETLVPTHYEVFNDILMVSSDFTGISISQMALKRLIDLVVGTIGMIIALPIILIVGIAIKIEDKGPIFFKQQRITRNNELFDVYKLRSMKVDASIAEAKKDDDRITKVGKVIRKLRVDEFPQFINILKGDMSLVGPRPDNLYIKSQIINDLPQYDYRVKVKGGLTGYAQIFGKYNTDPRQKLILDLEYINNYSVWKDIQLIFLTLTVFFKKDSTEGFD